MSKEAAEADLREWASTLADRDNRVRRAHAKGVSKHRIHALSGIARTTIDRILKEKTVAVTVHQLTATTTETGPSWARSIAVWTEAAREATYEVQDTGETKTNNRPVILVDGDRFVLNRTYDGAAGHTTVTAEKEP